jgi:DDE family transposase
MRHGRKSQHQRFDGFKLSAAVTNTSEPLIAAVDVAPACEEDGPRAKHLLDTQPLARRPLRVLGDTAYGTGPVRAELAERGIDVLAPLAPGVTTPGASPSAISTSIWTLARSPARPGAPPRSAASPPANAERTSPSASATRARCASAAPPRAAIGRSSSRPTRNCCWPPAKRSRTGRGRAPAPHPAADRTTPWPARRPLRRPQEPLLRTSQSPVAGCLGRRTGQSQPDSDATWLPTPPERPTGRPTERRRYHRRFRAGGVTAARAHFFRSLLADVTGCEDAANAGFEQGLTARAGTREDQAVPVPRDDIGEPVGAGQRAEEEEEKRNQKPRRSPLRSVTASSSPSAPCSSAISLRSRMSRSARV